MKFDDDDGLPDEAFTEEELRAGVQHIMRSGRAFNRILEEDGDYPSQAGATASSNPSARAPVSPPPVPTTRGRNRLFAGRLNFPGEHPISQFLAELRSLSPHVHYIWENSRSNNWNTIVPPFIAQTFAADLSRLSCQDLARLRDLLDDHLDYERKHLAWLRREISRDRRMKAGQYGEEMSRRLIGIEEQAVVMVDAMLASHRNPRRSFRDAPSTPHTQGATMYSLEDLAAANAELDRWNNAYANDKSNNPNKYEAQRRDAGVKVRRIEEFLKREGLVERSKSEVLNDELDRLYPNAKSRSIVTHNGRRYQVRYFPLVESRSGKSVKEWGHTWTEL